MAYGNRGRQAAGLFDREEAPAEGFLNLSFPNTNGGESKIGFVVLRGQSAVQRQLIDAIKACGSDEAKLNALIGKMVVKYNSAESSVKLAI